MEQKWANKLNNDEFNLITDPWYPILKKGAMEKIKAQLAILGAQMQDYQPHLSYKISAGENLLNLPYLVLDFPKISGNDFPYLFRTLFWWGKPISYQVLVRTKPSANLCADLLKASSPQTYVLMGNNLWENDFNSAHFKQVAELNELEKEALGKQDYIKLVGLCPIKKSDNLFEEAIGFYENYRKIILSSQQSL